MTSLILLIIVVITALYAVFLYNRLVTLNNLSKEGWSGIDVQLKQRADLIPNLIESVKGYMGHEKSVLEKVTALRAQCASSSSIHERADNENMLSQALRQLFAVSENYPDLKASQNFINLQENLVSIENQIQLARRYYNGTARDLNIAIERFPSNIIAKSFAFTPVEYFEVADKADRETPKVSFS